MSRGTKLFSAMALFCITEKSSEAFSTQEIRFFPEKYENLKIPLDICIEMV